MSPVIGVVLMVAITVILAAVIATFVLGMTNNIPVTRSIATTITQPDANHIVVTYSGGPDAGSFQYGIVSITPGSGSPITIWENTTSHGAPASQQYILGSVVGNSVTATGASGQFIGRDHLLVTARFKDGAMQVILNTYI